jgi:hypothetical protein
VPAGPFLSHNREQATDLEVLGRELRLRGAGGWRDVEKLEVGRSWKEQLREAIYETTDGFIWWGTPESLQSRTIRKLEVPAALRRARARGARAPYPVVPIFVCLSPEDDAKRLRRAFGRRRARALTALQGTVRLPEEPIEKLARRAARRYVRDLVRSRDSAAGLEITISGKRPATAERDLFLDWRCVLKDGFPPDPETVDLLRETLADIRNAAQERTGVPRFIVEPDLRLPLAALVGWEWSRSRSIALEVEHVYSSERFLIPERPSAPVELPAPEITELEGKGPAILVVSTVNSPVGAASRYAEEKGACRIVHLHVPGNEHRVVGPNEIACLSERCAEELGALNDEGLEKHLIILGPSSLAVWIGAKAHGSGPTQIPFWDKATGYKPGIEIG